jgi:trans-aconitate methyltransferase
MANRSSNRQRNRWIVDLLELRPDSSVLEIGFGPGYAISLMAEKCPSGRVVGIDHSETMVQVAAARNALAVENGVVQLHCASVEKLDGIKGEFDRIVAVNAYKFWPDRVEMLRRLKSRLAPGGRLAIGEQPRAQGADDEMARRTASDLDQELRSAGFTEISTLERALKPLVVCVVGVLPDAGGTPIEK